jgi:alkylation response protein AidB-like acyl-CoA dehydrogenase
MTFAPTAEHEELRQVLRSFLESKSREQDVRDLLDDELGYDPAVWLQLAEQIGAPALCIPEPLGGAGYGLRELGVVFEEAGRALLCSPLLSTTGLATQALLLSDDEQAQKDLLPGIAEGATVATLVWLPESGRGPAQLVASETANGWTLSGTASFVIDGQAADLILVVAEGSLFAVQGSTVGLTRRPLDTLDVTRPQSHLTFDATAARLVGTPGSAGPLLARVLAIASTMLALEQVGGAAKAMESAVEYAKIRHQFGRPIGSFQAVKHKCADMYVAVEAARATALYALWALAESPEEFLTAASTAKAYCSEVFVSVATESIQVHGGIGFTWEHPAHLYYRRARSTALMLGTASEHRELIAQQVGL